ncbi:tetratricopeptide repeat protein [Streptomyces sp. NPDC021354]|uniref:tetratricopeptide repeat protein n=1 Tax=Streptomyces sp. NPDC021354 TaxID=3154793 RepID=UPI0033E44A0A
MGEYGERFRAELTAVYEAAGSPTLMRLVRLGQEQKPPVKVAASTIHGWLNGPAVPGGTHTRYFLALTAFLQGRAAASGSSYVTRSQARWQELLRNAREERDAARGGRPRTVSAPVAQSSGPVTLPVAPADFTGRTAELKSALQWLEPRTTKEDKAAAVVVSAVEGMGGVGKTALALHAAHQARARGWFPGGILFADLRGYSHEPVGVGETADRFLRALGVRAKDLPDTVDEKVDAWRLMLESLAKQRQPLLAVLDNVRSAGQISALLPGPPHRALVTSRHSLSSLAAYRIDLAPLSPEEAVAVLNHALQAGDTGDSRVSAQQADALRLAKLCGYLPLALRIISALLRDEPDRPLADQAAELEDERTRLDAMAYDNDDDQGRPLVVRASFALSYRHLTSSEQRAFRLLAAAPGPDISTTAAAELLDQAPAQARRLLANLARARLLVFTTISSISLPVADVERWAMHDLIRLFADELGRPHSDEDGRPTAVARLLDYYLATAEAAASHLQARAGQPHSEHLTTLEQALGWLETERVNLLSAATAPPSRHHALGAGLASTLGRFFTQRRYLEDWITLTTSALAICREHGDRHSEGTVLRNLGIAMREVRRFEEAIDAHNQAAAICREFGDRHGEGKALNSLGIDLREVGRFEEAIDAHRQAAAIFQEVGDRYSEGTALGNLGADLREVRRFDEAIDAHRQAAAICREFSDRYGEGTVLRNLGIAMRAVCQFEEAIDAHRQAAAIFQEVGDRYSEGTSLNSLGVDLREVRRFDEAIDAHNQAAAIFREFGDRNAEGAALQNLGVVLAAVYRFEEAIDAHNQAAAIFWETGDPYRERKAVRSGAVAHNERWLHSNSL